MEFINIINIFINLFTEIYRIFCGDTRFITTLFFENMLIKTLLLAQQTGYSKKSSIIISYNECLMSHGINKMALSVIINYGIFYKSMWHTYIHIF